MSTKGIYIYGIIPSFYSTDMFRSLENTSVYPITFQNISAIVSESSSGKLDSLDRESLGRLLVHHQKTIETLQSKEFSMFIPMKSISTPSPPPCGGRAREGVEIVNIHGFYPHPNLPPARGKGLQISCRRSLL